MDRIEMVSDFSLWFRWVLANALAEGIGLGLTLLIDYGVITGITSQGGPLAIVSGILLFAASGAVEGFLVGLLQWNVMKKRFSQIRRSAWIRVTMIGAVMAWFFGSLPSSLMDMAAQESGTPVQEPPQAVVLLLAAGMGLVLGAVLGLPQARELNKFIKNAWAWVLANCAAWALGMPVIFSVMDIAFRQATLTYSILVMLVSLLIAGAVVGAVHGLVLVWLSHQERLRSTTADPSLVPIQS